MEKAERIFLWTHLVLSSKHDRILAGKILVDLKSCVDEFPAELERYSRELVYDRIHSTWQQGQRSETACALILATLTTVELLMTDLLMYWSVLVATDLDINERNFYENVKVGTLEREHLKKMYETSKILKHACKDMFSIKSSHTKKWSIPMNTEWWLLAIAAYTIFVYPSRFRLS